MKIYIISFILCILFFGCRNNVTNPKIINSYPSIYPDYIKTTIPYNIAPLNFSFTGEKYELIDVIICDRNKNELHSNGKIVSIPDNEWHRMLEENKGDSLNITVSIMNNDKWRQYAPFAIYVSSQPIDRYLSYRLIAPGYEVYSKMGIYQRDLTTFEQKAIIENTLVTNMCVNCHSFNQTDPKETSIHVRGENGATILINGGNAEYLNTKTDSTISNFVYPYWHPSGKYIAYSTNKTLQAFHSAKDERIEVFDMASDIVIYHPKSHEIITSPKLKRPDVWETYPVFSPDGKNLYFCSAKEKDIKSQFKDVKYNLCRIDFNPSTGKLGDKIDTLVNSVEMGHSISFPRPSYDGKYIMYTLSDYGNFSIWHKEADLWIYNIEKKKSYPMTKANSNDTESFHSWSSNSKWFVFTSRREDGLYSRLYISNINEKGEATKPFLLPQKNPEEFYKNLDYSYNVPELIKRSLNLNINMVKSRLSSKEKVNVKMR